MTAYSFDGAYRPTVLGSRYVVSAGHYLGSQAAFLMLEAGGNAIDAGVAAGIALNIVEPEICSFTGVAPIMIYLAAEDRFVTIDGLGTWSRHATAELLGRHGGDCVPEGILQSVVPGAPDAWLTALEKYGTMSFAEVAATAIRLARDGFPAHPVMVQLLKKKTEDFPPGSAGAAIFLPNGKPPEVGDLFVQKDLAKTLQYLADQEAAARSRGREQGIAAVRECLYRGELAKTFADFQQANGGLLDREDFASYHATIEPPHSIRYRDIDVYGCGPWCQGPMLLQILRLVDALKLDRHGHNSREYIHGVIEVIKLVAADREAYYGDPKFVSVPLEQLLSEAYAQARAAQFRPDRAWPAMPPAGALAAKTGARMRQPVPAELSAAYRPHDTSYVCVIDADGNAFSATPSDGIMRKSPVVPGTGMAVSPRGLQSRIDPAHPASVAPRKRPRLTPNPAMVRRKDGSIMAFGTPGGDLQVQAMTQVFMNLFAFGMKPQHAVEATRFYSYSYPDSFAPHAYYPGLLKLEDGIPEETAKGLSALGHKVERWPNDEWPRTGVCLVMEQASDGLKLAAADSRRTGYALGW